MAENSYNIQKKTVYELSSVNDGGGERSLNSFTNTDEKLFIHSRDFYRFIRTGNGEFTPLNAWHFSVVFTPTTAFSNTNFFNILRMTIQSIKFPDTLQIKGVSNDDGTVGEGTFDASTIFGGYTALNNSYVHPAQRTFTCMILNTQFPIIEKFIYNWMKSAVSPNYSATNTNTNILGNLLSKLFGKNADRTIFPKVNMIVRFWGPNRVHAVGMDSVSPNFIYYLTEVFPISMNLATPSMNLQEGSIARPVTFSFNDFLIFNNKSEASQYDLGYLFPERKF